jgi:hypothetical protein
LCLFLALRIVYCDLGEHIHAGTARVEHCIPVGARDHRPVRDGHRAQRSHSSGEGVEKPGYASTSKAVTL